MKRYHILLLVLALGGLSACVPIRPIYISPAPSPFFHKENGVVGGAIVPLTEPNEAIWVSGEYLKWKNRDALTDWGVIPHFVASESVNSGNAYLYLRKWFKSAAAENPWGNIHGGLQVAVNQYGTYNDTLVFPLHIDFAFTPGVYRKRFNLAFPIRLGMGTTLTERSVYMYAGPGIQSSFNVTSKLIFQAQFNFTLGLGASESFLYLPIPALITIGLHYRF